MGNYTVPFGPHKGQSFKDVSHDDLMWLHSRGVEQMDEKLISAVRHEWERRMMHFPDSIKDDDYLSFQESELRERRREKK